MAKASEKPNGVAIPLIHIAWYLQPMRQGVVLCLTSLSFLVIYLLLHFSSSVRERYERTTVSILTNQISTYSVVLNPASGRLDLYIGSDHISSSANLNIRDSDLLGIENLPSVKGLINRWIQRLGLIDAQAGVSIAKLINQGIQVKPDLIHLPFQAIAPQTAGRLLIKTNQLPQHIFIDLSKAGFGDIQTTWNAVRFARIALDGGEQEPGDLVAATKPELSESDVAIANSIAAANRAADAQGQPATHQAWSPEARRQVDAFFLRIYLDINRHIISNTFKWPLEEESSAGIVMNLNRALQAELTELLRSEFGFFWLFGCWRWLEISFWIIFGVYTQALFKLGWFLAGKVSRPRKEIFRVFYRLIYAPLLGLVVFWVVIYTFEGETPLDFGRSTPAILAYGFIFGLFPNTTYRFLKDLARKLLPGSATNSDVKSSEKISVPEMVETSQPDPGKPPSLEQLLENIRNIIKAPAEFNLRKK